jgi:hypothetical protein
MQEAALVFASGEPWFWCGVLFSAAYFGVLWINLTIYFVGSDN